MHREAITSEAGHLLSALAKFKPLRDFCLVEGTALALQIGHRISVDLDWFSPKPLKKNLLSDLKDFFSGQQILTDVLKKEELTVRIDGVQITFFHYPFPWAEKPIKESGFTLASVKQIAMMKGHALARRAAFKDYVDLYFILREKHVSLTEIINKAKHTFKEEFNQRLFLEQLVYMEDITEEGLIFLEEKPNKQKIQKFFEQQVKNIKL